MDSLAHDLDRLADHLLEQALASPEKRGTLKLDLGQSTLRHMAMAFDTGGGLPEHSNPGEATLRVLRGAVRLSWASETGEHEIEARPGMLVRIPDAKHRVEALEPSVMLLTAVSLPGGAAH